MTIVIGCDDAAVAMKDELKKHLIGKGINVEDCGCTSPEDKTYYPIIAEKVCKKIIDSNYEKRGVLICGTGIGMCMSANKCPGIRAAVCHDVYSAERSILSNDGNVVCFGARVIGVELAKTLLTRWTELKFIPSASSPKVNEIKRLEKDNFKRV